MEFNLAEKLAIVKAIDEVILADGEIAEGEIAYLGQLMAVLEFDMDFVNEARKFNASQAMSILRRMSEQKKHSLAIMLDQMARADGNVDEEEMKVIISVFLAAGIRIGDSTDERPKIDLSDIYFESSDHVRYQNGQHVSGPHGGAKRAVKVETNIEGKEGFTVTVYNLDGVHPVWGNNVQMAPKQMKVISSNSESTELRGWGEDPKAFGHPDGSFADYGITINHPENEIESIVLHMHDRSVDIKYLI